MDSNGTTNRVSFSTSTGIALYFSDTLETRPQFAATRIRMMMEFQTSGRPRTAETL